LREMLAGEEPVLAPGAFNALSARLVEGAGFEAVYITGFGASASLLGRPDVGLLSFGEMVDNARRIVQAVSIPVIADADDGYGNPINVIRTVREYEAAGVSAVHIEDQVSPKKCGHMEGKQVIGASEMVEKVRAAVEARASEEFVIIARTDARAVEGMEGALERARLYREAGADALFVEAPQSEEEVASVAEAFAEDVPLLFNWVESGQTPPVPLERLKELGYRLVIFPISTLLAATGAMKETLARIRAEGSPVGTMDELLGFGEFTDLIGLPEIQELEERYEDEEVRTPR
ncbi:MAG: isocitrate lyase/PEP mutase family protein, partial [Actinomycetota bacterium]|nr:isocitrate lyase/PEP mutase family protein [Actinomycetota bacterium]